ncbi:hypothetical protein SteCoe_28285 [Stentor coeruleus]|uniref:Uncharacterized protein n=1 Tax=Stentor coeruleus TaxID=5963 RepID=A0A1R2B8K0_9CILI|nr:hypothetical protein SteCoe_28285 [Stentor coeruleus]
MVDRDNLAESSSIGVSAVVLVISSTMSLHQMYRFFSPARYFEAQKYLISIFLMPVLIGWVAWVELLRDKKTLTLTFTYNLFKSICLICFMLYIEKMLGWEQINGKNVYSDEKKINLLITDEAPKCIYSCIKFSPIRTKEDAQKYMTMVKIYILQFSVVLIIFGVIGLIMILSTSEYKFSSPSTKSVWMYFSGVQFISSLLALLFLLNFGMYVNKMPEMHSLQILHKFVIIKLGLIFTELQPLIILGIASSGAIVSTSDYTTEEITVYTNSLLICTEMIIMSFLLILIFPVSDYEKSPDVRKSIALEEDNYFKI